MTARRKSPKSAAAGEPKRRTKGAKVYNARILPKVRMLLGFGADEFNIAAYLGIEVETLLEWAAANNALQEALDSREEIRAWDHERNLTMARELMARGATEAEIAQAFRVSERTITRWRQRYPDFDEALTMGADLQLAVAERTLFKMATGFIYEEERIVSTKSGLFKVREQKRALPSEGMLRLYLASNKPEKYSAKPRPDGGEDPIADFSRTLNERGVGGVVPVEKEAG